MIKLTDPHWNDLQDAYGDATRVPQLLEQVIADKSPTHNLQSGPWFDLWSRLYHQGSIYTASYAAVPVIADAVKRAEGILAMDFFLLPASIELARTAGNGPAVPADIEGDYQAAIRELGELAERYRSETDDVYLQKAAEAAHLIAAGRIDEARELIDA